MGWAQDLPEWSALGIEPDVMSVLPSRSPKRSALCAPMAATGVIASARIALGAVVTLLLTRGVRASLSGPAVRHAAPAGRRRLGRRRGHRRTARKAKR